MSSKSRILRTVPEGWRLVPRELLSWSTPLWGEKVQEVNKNNIREGRVDLQSGTKRSKSDKKSALIMTYRACEYTTPTSDIRQKMLSGFDIRVLSELIHLIQSKDESPDDTLLFEACELLRGLGFKHSGSTLDKVERSLEDLASFRVETSIDRTGYGDFLLGFAETGNISVLNGVKSTDPAKYRKTAEGHKKRHQFWRVQLGNLVRAILRYPTLLTSYPLSVYKAAGRLPISQWLAMDCFTHGHDGSHIYEYKLTTLAKKANLPDRITQRMTTAMLAEATKQLSPESISPESINSESINSEPAIDKLELQGKIKKLAQKSLEIAAAHVRKGLQRIIDTGIFDILTVIKPENLLQAKVKAKRYDTSTELALTNLISGPS